jgi:predicted RNA methylase
MMMLIDVDPVTMVCSTESWSSKRISLFRCVKYLSSFSSSRDPHYMSSSVSSFKTVTSVAKYYAQRRRIFSIAGRDDDLQMTINGWCEASLEHIARFAARKLRKSCGESSAARCIAVDFFSGVGVDCIALAGEFDHVIGVDIDPAAIQAATSNAAVYGVSDKVTFVCADVFGDDGLAKIKAVTEALKGASTGMTIAAHFSPPWGGTAYFYDAAFDVTSVGRAAGVSLPALAMRIDAAVIAVYVPRNTSLARFVEQLAEARVLDGSSIGVTVMSHAVNGKVKGLTLFSDLRQGDVNGTAHKRLRSELACADGVGWSEAALCAFHAV